MSEWRGLTEPEWHETNEDGQSAYCTECWDTHCSQELPCKCCGKAEVERLTAGINAALTLIEAHWISRDVIPDLGGIEAFLRGESDE